MTYSQANMETAMCLWEAALDLRDRLPTLHEEWERAGTVPIRHAIIALVPDCEAAWVAARAAGTEQEPYDWEHCPAFLISKYGPLVSQYFYQAVYLAPDGYRRSWSITVRATDESNALLKGAELLQQERPGAADVDEKVSLDRDQ